MVKLASVLLFTMAFALSMAVAQPLPQGTIEGEVMNISSGEPVGGARVRIQSGQEEPRFTTSDENGHFKFGDLEVRPYMIAAQKQGLISANQSAASSSSGELVRLTSTAPAARVRIDLRPYSAISGKVTDASGIPVEGVDVELLSRYTIDAKSYQQSGATYKDGAYKYLGQQRVRTNDLGEYRIAPLPPGTYYLAARYIQGLTYTADRDTFYPQSLSPSDATPIELKEGADLRGIDIQMRHAAGVTVSGIIRPLLPEHSSPSGGRLYTSVSAWAISATGSPAGIPSVSGDRFEISGLLPGNYVLEAATREPEDVYLRNPLAAARRIVAVGTEPVNSIELAMSVVPQLEGRVIFEPGCRVTPMLIEARGDFHQGTSIGDMPTNPDGSFVIKRLLPGSYSITVRAEGDMGAMRPKVTKLGDVNIPDGIFEANDHTRGPLLITVGCPPARR
jgi:hypothetical protein